MGDTSIVRVYQLVTSSGWRQDNYDSERIWASVTCGHVIYFGTDGPSRPLSVGFILPCPDCLYDLASNSILLYIRKILKLHNDNLAMGGRGAIEKLKLMHARC